MKISWAWLRELLPGLGAEAGEVARRLTMAGLEVEAIERRGGGFSGVVVAEVRDRRPHPKADKLTVVVVDDGAGSHTVVCGASNVPAPGGQVLWARPGARLPDGREIGQKELRGVASAGMICSAAELGLGDDAGGIVVLAGEDAAARPGTPAQEALGLADTVLEVNVTPNRGDCLGHLGVAREVGALFGVVVRPPPAALEALAGDRAAADLVSVAIEDPEGCPRYTARVLEDLAVRPSPRWLRRRLEAVGVRPINNLVDVTNYVMFELGQPLHAFDLDRVAGGRIVVRRAAAGERMVTLDGQERGLAPGDLLVCDARGPVALAGVMGGAGSEVSAATTRVLLESACFHPPAVRRTARRLALHSESSHRFERGVDATAVDFASARAARLLGELGGGKVARGLVDAWPRKAAPVTLELRPSRAQLVLGMPVEPGAIARHLGALGLAAAVGPAPDTVRVTVPAFRPDLEREIDLIEEIGRLEGFEHIPTTLPPTREAPSASGDPLADAARDALCAAGMLEAVSYGFTSPARIAALRFREGHPATRAIPVRNPLREEQSVMRTSLMPNLLAALAHNLAHGTGTVRLFEVGHVFLPSGQVLPDEPRFVAGVLAGERAGWLKPGGPVDFFDVRGVVEALFARLRVEVDYTPARQEDGFLHPGVAAAVVGKGEGGEEVHLGVLGEVHPETRERFGVDRRCFAFELNLERFPPPGPARMRPIPRFPAVVRDVSFFVDDFVPAARIRQLLSDQRPPTLEALRVLDDYREPGKVPQGKKGMLWSMTYRAPDRTLTDAEVDQAHEALVGKLLAAIGAERR